MTHARPRRIPDHLPRPRRGRRRRAFTLPEVLAALVFVGITLPAVMKGISLALAASDDARKKIEATALAENKLADLAAAAASQTQDGATSGDFSPDRPAYRWESASVVVDVDVSEVTVRVGWTARGAERSVILSTLVYTGAGGSVTTPTPSGGAS